MTSMNHFFSRSLARVLTHSFEQTKDGSSCSPPLFQFVGMGIPPLRSGAVYLGTNWGTSESEYQIGGLQKTLTFKGK